MLVQAVLKDVHKSKNGYIIKKKKGKNIDEYPFKECTSLRYTNHTDMINYMDTPTNYYGNKIQYIKDFSNDVFQNCTSLEAIKLYGHEYFRRSILFSFDNVQRIS